MEADKSQNRSFGNFQDVDEINLLDYLLVLVRHKKRIFVTGATAFVLGCVITLLMPNVYTATARIMPPPDQDSTLSSLLGGMGGLASLAGVSLGQNSGDLYVGMLQSRTVSDALIDRFELMKVYDEDYRVKAYDKLADHVSISVDKDSGIISVGVEDEDPQRAAAMANEYVADLQRLNLKLSMSSAGKERAFLENRLKLVKRDLAQAEDRLKDFKEKHQAISIDDQATAIIDAIAQLKAQLSSQEVQLGVLRSYQTERNPEVGTLKEGIAQLKDQIRRLEQSPAGKKVSGDIFIPTSEVPDLGIQYARLMRDFKVQETLFELLTKQYEISKINEARNTSTIQVLDHATVPDKKSKPKRALIVLLITFSAGFLAVISAFVGDYLTKMPEEDRDRWAEIKREARFEFRRRKKGKNGN